MERSDLPSYGLDDGVDAEVKAAQDYLRRLRGFEQVLDKAQPKTGKRRKSFNDYSAKNCEEAWGGA